MEEKKSQKQIVITVTIPNSDEKRVIPKAKANVTIFIVLYIAFLQACTNIGIQSLTPATTDDNSTNEIVVNEDNTNDSSSEEDEPCNCNFRG